ncbi:MAG: hypothetical protein MUO54_08625 [Anaerolineales bacterium]|nr:hypothetical protein [Anaerolineales bacterium]
MRKKRISQLILILCLAFIVLWGVACQSPENQSTTTEQISGDIAESNNSNNVSEVEPGNSTTEGNGSESDQDLLTVSLHEWETSPHANAFVVDDQGNNNSCSQCHAPVNWMPTLDDIPESCLTCKFELEPPPPYIPENEWMHIPCLVCHEENKKGIIQPEITWLEIPALEEYASVETPTELCLKCHNTENVKEHGMVIVGGDHKDMQCTECHLPHSTAVSCVSGDCHPAVYSAADTTPGHDEIHQDISCAACHDSAGWEVGPNEDLGYWITNSPWSHEIMIGEADTKIETGIVPFTSHEIGLEANCDRCHSVDNQWGLTENVDTP